MRKDIKGLTLTELLITIFIMGFIFSLMLIIVVLIRKSFADANERSDMQQQAMIGLSRLSTDLLEASSKTLTIYNPLEDTSPTGIIFASARDPAQNNKFDVDFYTGKPVWHKYICYYLDRDPENPSTQALFRKEKEFIKTLSAQPSSESVVDFKNDNTLFATIISHQVDKLDFEPTMGTRENLGFTPLEIKPYLPLEVTLSLSDDKVNDVASNSISITFRMNMQNN